ncbi:MAG: hypothetical protein JRG70_05565 [Deltaproteobacteria bacterium]|nr:hypothetical protein [Deltaproteobacteria bacterium]
MSPSSCPSSLTAARITALDAFAYGTLVLAWMVCPTRDGVSSVATGTGRVSRNASSSGLESRAADACEGAPLLATGTTMRTVALAPRLRLNGSGPSDSGIRDAGSGAEAFAVGGG